MEDLLELFGWGRERSCSITFRSEGMQEDKDPFPRKAEGPHDKRRTGGLER